MVNVYYTYMYMYMYTYTPVSCQYMYTQFSNYSGTSLSGRPS